MNTRRSFIGRVMASIGAVVALPFAAKAEKSRLLCEGEAFLSPGPFYARRPEPIDVTGKPTPIELIQGVPGQRYFMAGSPDPLIRCDEIMAAGCHIFFNGVHVDCRVSEFDVTGQWARMYDVESGPDAAGIYVFAKSDEYQKWQTEFTNDGFILKGSPPSPPDTREFIHFGHVEIR